MVILNERFDVLLHEDGTRRIAPSDIALHQHLDGCQRFLRLRLYEHNVGGSALAKVMRRHGLTVQSPTPLPAILGQQFEHQINAAIVATGWQVAALGGIDALHNRELVRLIHALPRGQGMFVLQPNIEVVAGQWTLTGRPDVLRIERHADDRLHILITDIKSAFHARPEHRTQVALYHVMLDAILTECGAYTIATSILHQFPQQPARDADTHLRLTYARAAAQEWYGVADVCLDMVAHPHQLRDDVARLLAYDPRSPLLQSVEVRFSELPYAICRACEGCRYMELCLTDSDQRQDVALIPLLDRETRQALWRHSLKTVSQVADLKRTTAQRTLDVNPQYAAAVTALSSDSTVGALLDHWIVRAQQLRNRSDHHTAVAAYPEHAFISLPRINAEKTPTAVVLYVDVHVDHFSGLLWQCGGMLDYYINGVSYAQYHAVEIAPAPPRDHAVERRMLHTWLLRLQHYWDAHIRNVDTTHVVPLHIVVYDTSVWNQLLDALGRHTDDDVVCRSWHDFLTTPRPHDAPLYTVLSDEVRNANRLTATVPSLMALASMQGFGWQDERYNYRTQFQYMHFDASGRLPHGDGYYIQRARFSSSIPLEYAYAAWQALPTVQHDDAFARFRHMHIDTLVAYCVHRLSGLAHLAKRAGRWWNNRCDAVDIRTLADTHAAPTTLAGVLREYLESERQAELLAWRTAHEPFADARVRTGTSLIVEFCDAWQSEPVQLQLDQLRKTQHGNAPVPMNRVTLMMRVCDDGDLPARMQQFELNVLATDTTSAVLNPLYTQAGKQMWPDQLMQQGMRVKVLRRDVATGMLTLEVEAMQHDAPYSYGGRSFVPADATRYVLDAAPDNVPARVVNRAMQRVISDAEHNTLYRHLTGEVVVPLPLDEAAMQAYTQACDRQGVHFRGDARAYVAGFHDAAIMLVQGPPGTGKTFATAHAVLARMYAAMCQQRPLRVAVSCQTHAAINELLGRLADVKSQLATMPPALADALRRVALFRFRRPEHDVDQAGVQTVSDKGQMVQLLQAYQWCVIGATPTSIESLVHDAGAWSDLLILDEASQMSIPHALVAARVLHASGMIIVVGDPRQMPVIVAHDWATNRRRSFVQYPVYRALFDYLSAGQQVFGRTLPIARLATSFRVPPLLADFLRTEIYQHDGIAYHSQQAARMRHIQSADAFVAAALHADYPIVLIEHDESQSRTSNPFEARLVTALLIPLIQAQLDAQRGFGVVVPHRMQRATIKALLKPHMPARTDMLFTDVEVAGIDTVERYQGSERDVMIVSATESASDYIRRNEAFLFDLRRLNVALSRARHKVIVVASEHVLDYVAHDPHVATQCQLWKNLRNQWCTTVLYDTVIDGCRVRVRGHRNHDPTLP